MRKIFKLAVVTATVICVGFQTANAGLVGMPLNLRAAIESIDQNAVSMAPSPFYPRYIDDVVVEADLLIEC